MRAKHRRLILVTASLLVMALAATAILYSFRENMVFFYTPSQLREKQQEAGFDATRALRIGGLVKAGSVKSLDHGRLRFAITDLNNEISVEYRGLVPSLFREGQGVVAQGTLDSSGMLAASSILAKHDENYMPREVVDALKASGQWKEGEAYRKNKGAAP